MIEIVGWVSSELAPYVGTFYFELPTPTPFPEQMPAVTTTPQPSWWREFSTGPALGGVLALFGALFAAFRLGQQVKESRKVNAETERKNREDQWWDTLKWTYEEAKESKTNAGPLHEVAAAEIFNSLRNGEDKQTDQQKQALNSILNIFGQSKQPEVQEAVAPFYKALGRISPLEYETAVGQMLDEMNLGTVISEAKIGGLTHDFFIESGEKKVIIEVQFLSGDGFTAAVGRMLAALRLSPDKRNTAGIVLIPNTGDGMTSKVEAVFSRFTVIRWSPRQDTEPARRVLMGYLEPKTPIA